MTKQTLGSLANAQAAVALVARCAALLTPDTAAFYSGMVGPAYADRWRARVTADGAPFTFWALLNVNVAVKHNTDSIVYKCPIDPASTAGYTREKTLLDANAGKSWLPDYWYYDTAPNVMCIRDYPPYFTEGNVFSRPTEAGYHLGNGYSMTANETKDLTTIGYKWGSNACGVDPATGRTVLIDGTFP